MNRFRHITLLLAALLTMLSAVTCSRQDLTETEIPELQISLYIPGSTMTKADTDPDQEKEVTEMTVTSLRVWVFLHSNGSLVSYENFTSNLDGTALPNNIITRFGLPLTDEMFKTLTAKPTRPTVDVYAIANAESACTDEKIPGKYTDRAALDKLTLNKGFGGTDPTMEIPETGLPMSGVLKETQVTGGYPVLNITTLTLTRAVSKIRFVFCQQKNPDTGLASNNKCTIVSIDFDQTNQIARKEKLFTTNTTASGQLFDIGTDEDRYGALNASLTGDDGNDLIPNNRLSLVDDPEDLAFRSPGHDMETVERYETRLDEAIASDSQAGPIYLCETDHPISGTITYRTTNKGPDSDKTVRFSMKEGTFFPRNHSWIVYACFAEETMTLELRVVVMPWDWSKHKMDFSVNSVNVVRRFTVFDTNPKTFDKVKTKDSFYDVAFWHTVDGQEGYTIIEGDIIIATPVGGTLHIIPVPGALEGYNKVSNAILVSPASAVIYHNQGGEEGTVESCRIPITIQCNPAYITADPEHSELSPGYQLIGNYVDLHFSVQIGDGLDYVDLDSESLDRFRFIIWEDWTNWHLRYVTP